MDVKRYSYFIERRESDKRWVATVEEFPGLQAESKIHNRALNDLYKLVHAEVLKRHRAGEAIPAQPKRNDPAGTFLKALGLG